MISSVSSVSFKSNAPVQSAQERISAPGKYTMPEASAQKPEQAPKKKHGFLKALAGIVVAAVVVGGALLLGVRKGGLKVLDEVNLKDAKFMEKAKHYLAKAGEWVDTNIWQKISVKGKKAAEEAASKVEDVVAEVVE